MNDQILTILINIVIIELSRERNLSAKEKTEIFPIERLVLIVILLIQSYIDQQRFLFLFPASNRKQMAFRFFFHFVFYVASSSSSFSTSCLFNFAWRVEDNLSTLTIWSATIHHIVSLHTHAHALTLDVQHLPRRKRERRKHPVK